jgi:multicomponent Na+:H+ antiporter subunit G
MRLVLEIFSVAAIAAGAFFFLAGLVGLLRFPDSLSRLHALTKADTLGLGLIALGVLPQVAWPWDAAKVVFVWLLVVLASVSASQAVARRIRRDS